MPVDLQEKLGEQTTWPSKCDRLHTRRKTGDLRRLLFRGSCHRVRKGDTCNTEDDAVATRLSIAVVSPLLRAHILATRLASRGNQVRKVGDVAVVPKVGNSEVGNPATARAICITLSLGILRAKHVDPAVDRLHRRRSRLGEHAPHRGAAKALPPLGLPGATALVGDVVGTACFVRDAGKDGVEVAASIVVIDRSAPSKAHKRSEFGAGSRRSLVFRDAHASGQKAGDPQVAKAR
mmetsp:Transcript_94212/g.271417  ORF Transcript_94212/g.271417 Transcript_94212/m.271417 type:complete len:235 (-) Transcript_94212:15-719(-)